MSASDTLRRAAKVLREHAQAATDGPWEASRGPLEDLHFGVMDMTRLDAPLRNLFAVAGLPLADGEYVAMMHPLVGLALADWLGSAAIQAEEGERHAQLTTVMGDWHAFVHYPHWVDAALPVARLILRET